MFCAQSCTTPLSHQKHLFLTLPENIWIANTLEKYPVLPNPPPPIANYNGSIDASDRATTKAEWELSKKTFDECINMNAALVTRFLSLINPTFKRCYELTQLRYLNAPFLNVFDFFMQKYKRSNEQDRVVHMEETLPTITQVRHATNSTHQACTTPTQQDTI